MKPWQLSRKINSLSQEIADPVKTDTKIDWNCLSEPERQLLDKIREISDKYAPGIPPQDLINKNADLWYKGLEIFARRAIDLFVQVLPSAFCCDELEEWYFKLYFYNFWHDWMDSIKQLGEMPKEKREALLCERREMGMLDMVFRIPRSQPETTTEQKATRCPEQ